MQELYETSSIARMVEEQCRKWLLLTQGRAAEKRPSRPFPTITVSREKGSGGGILARHVAEQLGFVLFDSEIVNYIAQSACVDRLVVEHMDEQSRQSIQEWTRRVMQQQEFSPQTYRAHLTRAVLTIGEKGRAVMVGRGAHLILPPERCLRVRVIAPLEIRIQRVCAANALDHSAGQALVAETDRQRAAYILENFGCVDSAALFYDLVINTGELPLEVGTSVVVQAALGKFPQLQEAQSQPAVSPSYSPT